MSFAYPLGLLGLLAIPVVIFIYILKSKYTEQIITSTYLWSLSEKFLKRKNPISSITGILSLLLQILAITVISLLVAHPVIVVENSADEYCFILDGSASMNMTQDGKSCFEDGVEKIEQIINSSVDGSLYTVLYAKGDVSVVFEKISDKGRAKELLKELEPAYATADTDGALGLAQKYFDENPSMNIYFVTDKSYKKQSNVKVISVAKNKADNVGLTDLTCTLDGGVLTASACLRSYKRDATVKVEMYVDGSSVPAATQNYVVKRATDTPVLLSASAETYRSVKLVAVYEDSLALDNEAVYYNLENDDIYSILIVSETPFFLEAALDVVGDHTVTSCAPSAYTGEEKAGLYIFHSFTPAELPRDGAVWFINSDTNLSQTGFSVRGETVAEGGVSLSLEKSSATLFKTLTEGVSGEGIVVSKYMKYNTYRNFTTIFSYKENPLLMAGTNDFGNREVVFGFDIHNSNLPLTSDFLEILKNLIEYSFPNPIEKVEYFSGEEAIVNIMPSYERVKVVSPSSQISYVSLSNSVGGVVLNEVGVYNIIISVGGREETYYVYSQVPIEERNPTIIEDGIAVSGIAKNEKLTGEYDPTTLLFIVLFVLITADWMVYMYEKYQLR